MGRALIGSPTNRFSREYWELFDDFDYYITTDRWTDIQTDATSTVTKGENSTVVLLTSADNESATLATTTELFQFIANKAIYVETRILFTDAATATSNACLLWGLMDAIQLDRAVDGGQSIVINNSGAVIWKKSEGTAWIFETEIGGGGQTQSISTAVPQSSSYQTLAIDIIPISSTVLQARPFVNGAQLVNATTGQLIQHNITLGSSTEMDFGFELKGGHADDTTCAVDYMYGAQVR